MAFTPRIITVIIFRQLTFNVAVINGNIVVKIITSENHERRESV